MICFQKKNEYSAKTVLMAAQICEIGQISYRSAVKYTKSVIEWLINKKLDKQFSANILIGWHKEVSAIHLKQQCEIAKISKYFTFGIMADESTCGDCKIFVICFIYWDFKLNVPKVTLMELKNIDRCTGANISHIITESYKQYDLDPSICQTWIIDNMAYMSES